MTFEQAMRLAGLHPRDIVPDGRWRRCSTEDKPRKRNGAYVLSSDGLRGWWRNWALDDGVNEWSDGGFGQAPRDPAAEDRRRAAERAARVRAIRLARETWHMASPCRSLHPYIERKGLTALGTIGLRELNGSLVVPVLWRGSVISIQRITADGEKRFHPGAPVKGGHYALDRRLWSVTAFVEGLATGLAVYQCSRHLRVVVCFDAGNLLPVVQALRPHGPVVFAADNDAGTQARMGQNPGVEKATNAASLVGAGVAYPTGIEGTDWADALREWGERGSKRIERELLAAARYVEAPS